MRPTKSLFALAGIAVLLSGCASAEKKLGRGLNNLTEPFRMGELQRSYEQSYLTDGADVAGSRGVIHGINRTIGRTAVGAFEVVTFPIPSEPYFTPEHPVYPDSYKPGVLDSSTLHTDTNLGFDGNGDIAPMFPGSRFRVFGD
jgi:putative exosortase-associated protein (TIGR04073 family)